MQEKFYFFMMCDKIEIAWMIGNDAGFRSRRLVKSEYFCVKKYTDYGINELIIFTGYIIS
jgi:hypothetical protein